MATTVAGAFVWLGAAVTTYVLWRLLGALKAITDAASTIHRGLESSAKAAMETWNRLDEQIDRAEGRWRP